MVYKNLLRKKNVDLFTSHKVFSQTELESRHEILLENYAKVLRIEALTMLDMCRQDVLPAVSEYTLSLSSAAIAKQQLGIDATFELESAKTLSALHTDAFRKTEALAAAVESANIADSVKRARHYRDNVLTAMNELRAVVDRMESLTSSKYWPYPTYGDILFSVK